ncbi:unnamed protein product [Coffea canephora]|uniref:DH200=94 genomic scaffold, scaffold_1287 n=1 Tax=Coffea canephora TaxID=49390 RepID=A0A068VIQ4_COFCA|nr:unnamed protein product [Coffea canephora]
MRLGFHLIFSRMFPDLSRRTKFFFYYYVLPPQKLIKNNIQKYIREEIKKLHLRTQLELFQIEFSCNSQLPNLSSLQELCQVLAKTRKSMRYTLIDRLIRVLSEHGYVSNTCVLFILDDMRKASVNEGLEWGVFIGFGTGVIVETLILHSVTI